MSPRTIAASAATISALSHPEVQGACAMAVRVGPRDRALHGKVHLVGAGSVSVATIGPSDAARHLPFGNFQSGSWRGVEQNDLRIQDSQDRVTL
jgi:hypothetical protein